MKWRKYINYFKSPKFFLEHLALLRYLCMGILGMFMLILFLCIFVFQLRINSIFMGLISKLTLSPISYFHIYDGLLLPWKLSLYISGFISILTFLMICSLYLHCFFWFCLFVLPLPFCLYLINHYLVVKTWHFLYEIKPLYGNYMLNIKDVVSFIINMNICGLITIYTPFCIFFLFHIKVLPLFLLQQIRKYWILISVIVSGILAPADLLSHMIMSGIMILLFEVMFFLTV